MRSFPSPGVRIFVLALTVLGGGCAPASTQPVETTAPAATRSSIPLNFPLLGSWVTTITRSDLEAAGVVDPGVLNENAGRFTWTFDADGTWRSVQVSLDDAPVLTPVFSGTFVVVADAMVVTTTFPEQYRDDGLRYTWSTNADGSVALDLTNPPDPVLEAIVETHAWQPTSG